MNEEEDLGNYSDKEPDVVEDNDDEVVDDEVVDDEVVDDVSIVSEDDDFDDLEDENASQTSTTNEGDDGVEETKGNDNPNMTQNMSYYVSDDESEDGEDYLYKLDENVKTNFISKHHPEVSIHNFDEVRKLSVVVRNVKGIIVDPLHRTNPIMSKYEYTRVLGQRAKQIEGGSKPFVEVEPNIIDSYIIAENELRERKIPFIIRRPIPNGGFEYWNINDLEILI
jgi:DNA-directed RNA polymerase I, II, and III subunit RPABC2